MGAYKRLGKLRSGSELQSWIRARPRPLHGRKCADGIWRSCPMPKCRRERPARARFDDTVTDHVGRDALVRRRSKASQNFRTRKLPPNMMRRSTGSRSPAPDAALDFDAEVDCALPESTCPPFRTNAKRMGQPAGLGRRTLK